MKVLILVRRHHFSSVSHVRHHAVLEADNTWESHRGLGKHSRGVYFAFVFREYRKQLVIFPLEELPGLERNNREKPHGMIKILSVSRAYSVYFFCYT